MSENSPSLIASAGVLPIGKIGDAMMDATHQTKNVFRLAIDGKRITEEVVAAGKYDWSSSSITSRNFPMREGRGHSTIEVIDLGFEITSEEVLAEAKKRGLERPDYEDALFFGEQFPEKQREKPILFLHEPWRNSYGTPNVLVLHGDSAWRFLDKVWFIRSRDLPSVFAFARK